MAAQCLTRVLSLLTLLLLPSGKWTVQQAAELSVAAPTITASLDGRYMSALKEQRVAASQVFASQGLKVKAITASHVHDALDDDFRLAMMQRIFEVAR